MTLPQPLRSPAAATFQATPATGQNGAAGYANEISAWMLRKTLDKFRRWVYR
jgi:hypothetical protein